MFRRLCGLVLIAVFLPSIFAADKASEEAPFPLPEAAPKKDWEWDEDERFDELMEQLAINEASLDAVQAAIDKKTRRKSSKSGDAKRQDDNTRMMDRKGGGPMKWDQFYGTNAEKFFYHPIDPNTTYRTDTFLRQMGKAEDDKTGEDTPSRQSLPVHQRPPQWDYIYRANESARDNALADVAIAESEIERLEQRRTALEKEQAVLWCKLAFRAVQRLNVARKPLLRFELVTAPGNAGNPEKTKALLSAARFLAASLAVVEQAEQDQSVAFGGVASVVTQARESLEDNLLEVSALESEWESSKTNLGKFYKLSQMLADKSKTLNESYAGAMDGDLNKEAARKERFRGMLQESVIEYAQILLALNELADTMKTEWKVRVDTKQRVQPLNLAWGPTAFGVDQEAPLHSRLPAGLDALAGQPNPPKAAIVDTKALRRAFKASAVSYDPRAGVLTLGYDFSRKDQILDWEPPQNPLDNAKKLKGIHIAPLDIMTHRAVFAEARCELQFAIANKNYRGTVITAGNDILVSQKQWNGRVFEVCKKDVEFGQRDDTVFRISLVVGADRTTLKVNSAHLAVAQAPAGPFQFALHGGDNGADFGTVTISGKPDSEWFAGMLGQ